MALEQYISSICINEQHIAATPSNYITRTLSAIPKNKSDQILLEYLNSFADANREIQILEECDSILKINQSDFLNFIYTKNTGKDEHGNFRLSSGSSASGTVYLSNNFNEIYIAEDSSSVLRYTTSLNELLILLKEWQLLLNLFSCGTHSLEK